MAATPDQVLALFHKHDVIKVSAPSFTHVSLDMTLYFSIQIFAYNYTFL